MTRGEHLSWCRARALAHLDAGEPANAVASLVSDLGKHADADPAAVALVGRIGVLAVPLGPDAVREVIEAASGERAQGRCPTCGRTADERRSECGVCRTGAADGGDGPG